MRKFVSVLISALLAILTLGSLVTFATPVEGTDFVVIQDFETEELQNQTGPVPKDGWGNDHDMIVTGPLAISGQASFSVTVDRSTVSRDFLMTEPPAPAADACGIFFRLKTTAPQGGDMRIEADDCDENQWSYQILASVWVTEDGTVYRGSKTPVDSFSGYVFCYSPIGTNPPVKIAAMHYFAAGDIEWTGAVNLYDNVGYYKVSNNESDDEYRDLTAAIWEAYPDNPEAHLYITYEGGSEPVTSADAKCGIKPMLTANILTDYPDKTVEWSVIEGEATITNLAGDDAATSREQSCYVSFENSGTVVVRAAIKAQPEDYVDFTFNVLPDSTPLMNEVLNALQIGGTFRKDTWDAFQEQLEKANALLDKDSEEVTQKEYDDMVAALRAAIDALVEVKNPSTSAGTYTLWSLVILAFSVAIVFAYNYIILKGRKEQ